MVLNEVLLNRAGSEVATAYLSKVAWVEHYTNPPENSTTATITNNENDNENDNEKNIGV